MPGRPEHTRIRSEAKLLLAALPQQVFGPTADVRPCTACAALNVLARPGERGVNSERARAVLATAHERGALVRVPAPVLAEVYRGPRYDAAIDRLLNGKGLLVVPLTHEVSRVAGHLLARAKLGSAHAIDAFVVATAMSFDAALIATGDPQDIKRLVGSSAHVKVFSI